MSKNSRSVQEERAVWKFIYFNKQTKPKTSFYHFPPPQPPRKTNFPLQRIYLFNTPPSGQKFPTFPISTSATNRQTSIINEQCVGVLAGTEGCWTLKAKRRAQQTRKHSTEHLSQNISKSHYNTKSIHRPQTTSHKPLAGGKLIDQILYVFSFVWMELIVPRRFTLFPVRCVNV